MVDHLTIAHIRSVVLSCPRDISMTIGRLEQDYRHLTGCTLPYAMHGFSSARSLLLSLSEHLDYSEVNGETVVSIPMNLCNRDEAQIRRMVEKSKKKKVTSKRTSGSGKVTTTNHFRSRIQPLIHAHLDQNTQHQIKSLAKMAEKKGVVLTERSFWTQFQNSHGHRLDYLKNGFKTGNELLDYAVRRGLMRKSSSYLGDPQFLPCEEIESRKSNLELEKIKSFLSTLVKTMTGIPLHDLPALYHKQHSDDDFMQLVQAAGHHRIYPLAEQLCSAVPLSISRPSTETCLIGPGSSGQTYTVPNRDYPPKGPHLVKVVAADSVNRLDLALKEDSLISDYRKFSSDLQRIYNSRKAPLVSKLECGLQCVLRYKDEYLRVEVIQVKLNSQNTLCAVLRRLDSDGDAIFAPLPTSDLYALVTEAALHPRRLITVGLAWIRHLEGEASGWNERLVNEGYLLAFRAPSSPSSDDDTVVRVSLQSTDLSRNVGWNLVKEGFAEWDNSNSN